MTPREALIRELEEAETELDAAKCAQVAAMDAYSTATVRFQRAMMRLCDASEQVRRLPDEAN